MKKKFISAAVFGLLFVALIAMLCTFDVAPIGPENTEIGFSTLNGNVHNAIGMSDFWYSVSSIFGYLSIASAVIFVILGCAQMINRKSLLKVDGSMIVLGIFYVVVIAVYIFFEFTVINYRPVLIEGRLEASYPSSTTMLVTCVMPTAIMQLCERIRKTALKRTVVALCVAFILFMVIGRLISGVHWVSDIIGGALFSAGAVVFYGFATKMLNSTNSREEF